MLTEGERVRSAECVTRAVLPPIGFTVFTPLGQTPFTVTEGQFTILPVARLLCSILLIPLVNVLGITVPHAPATPSTEVV